MRTEVIVADTIDAAAERILIELKKELIARRISSRNNVIYFDGWDGLGASAVLRAIAARGTATSKQEPAASTGSGSVSAGLEFEQVIHIDCSKWESRRALQKAVAEQLELPAKVMEMFDKQEEEDDFRGVAQYSRTEVEHVTRVMYQHIQKLNRRLLVIFHNGSSEEIDLASLCGFPLSGYSTNKMLWTFQGRFRLKPRSKVDSALKSAGTTDAFLSATSLIPYSHDLWYYCVREEADELVAAFKINTDPQGVISQHAQVLVECFMYMLELCHIRHQSIYYDLATHSANYWICDGVINQPRLGETGIGAYDGDDGLWRTTEALQCEMQLDVEYHQDLLPLHLARFVERKPYWTSPACGIFLLTPTTRAIFQHSLEKIISVLKLSCCTINFPSFPFLCCHNLRFLWLDHCQVVKISSSTTCGAGTEDDDIRRCFQRLWVLDVRYTVGCDKILSAQMMDIMTHLRELNVMGAQGWDIGQLQGRLPNIRKLRVQKSTTIHCSCSEDDLFSEANKMELLDFSGNETDDSMRSLCVPGVGNSNSCLETVIVDGYARLEKISFKGCTNLKNILLRGELDNLYALDISSTAVKTLDLTTIETLFLDELFLLDCKKLCAVMWPPKDKRDSNIPGKLRIDTTQSAQPTWCGGQEENSSTGTLLSYIPVLHGNQLMSEFDWYISLRDPRLLVSLEPVYSSSRKTYVEISSTNVATGSSKYERTVERGRMSLMPMISTQQQKQSMCALIYADITMERLQQGDDESNYYATGIGWMWPCPDAPHLPKQSCYMQIQDQQGTITVPDFVIHHAKILHVKDSLSITILPSSVVSGSEWHVLEWCRIERCPKLEYVFEPGHIRGQSFEYKLKTFWASQLLKAYYIWKWGEPSIVYRICDDLTYLHLDFCPRLVHILPLGLLMNTSREEGANHSFRCLETLEIMWCGDLREVFPLDLQLSQLSQQQQRQRHLLSRLLQQRQRLEQLWQQERQQELQLQKLERQRQLQLQQERQLRRQREDLEQQRQERALPVQLQGLELERLQLQEKERRLR
ncbi:hypothetical protein EJB05_15488, partial [Eragrostis curvula]